MRHVSAGWLCVFLLLSGSASGQTIPLTRLLPSLIVESARLVEPAPADQGTDADHANHFVPGLELDRSPAQLNAALALQLTLFPTIDAWPQAMAATDDERAAGIVARPMSAEGAETLGRGNVGFGVVQQSLHFSGLDSLDLEDGQIKFFLEHNDCCPTGSSSPTLVTDLQPPSERDLLEESVSIDLDRNVFAALLSYGLTDRLDVGVALPIVKVNLRGRVTSRVLRTATADSPDVHAFDRLELANRTTYTPDDSVRPANLATGTASGLGDVIVRAKVGLLRTENGGLAGVLSAQLPTGDEANLLGTGGVRTEARAIFSWQRDRWGIHANGGFVASTGTAAADLADPISDTGPGAASGVTLDLPNEIRAAGGVDFAIARHVVLNTDLVVRRITGLSRFAAGSRTFLDRGPGTLPTTSFVAPDQLRLTEEVADLTQVFARIGGQLRLGRSLALTTSVLVPVVDVGLTPHVGVDAGFSYLF